MTSKSLRLVLIDITDIDSSGLIPFEFFNFKSYAENVKTNFNLWSVTSEHLMELFRNSILLSI